MFATYAYSQAATLAGEGGKSRAMGAGGDEWEGEEEEDVNGRGRM